MGDSSAGLFGDMLGLGEETLSQEMVHGGLVPTSLDELVDMLDLQNRREASTLDPQQFLTFDTEDMWPI